MKTFICLALVTIALLQVTCGEEARNCDTACPDIYQPLCIAGSRIPKRTVANECEFAILKCQNPAEVFHFVEKGSCPPSK